MKYVDGFVLVVSKDRLQDYREMAKKGGEIWKKHGALEYFECISEDMNSNPEVPEDMKGITFPELTKTKHDEIVVFSFIIFESREHRDEVNKKVMEDPEMNSEQFKDKPMPFDMKRMCYGGFEVIVEEKK